MQHNFSPTLKWPAHVEATARTADCSREALIKTEQ